MSAQEETKQSPDYSAYMRRAALLQRQSSTEFSRALACAKKAAARGEPELAVEWCRYGASGAWLSNPGFFYCHGVEQLLSEIGQKYANPVTNAFHGAASLKRFLHVMTTAYMTGGHSRVVSRWIETCSQHAPSERHSVLILKQADEPLPSWLAFSAQKSGGELIQLPPMRSWLHAAAEVRAKALEFDVIVLHTHPNDPLPNLAFYDQPRPVIFFNHADLAFTLGTSVARVIANFRPLGQGLSLRYGAERPSKVLLPIPLLDDRSHLSDKAHARNRLGLPVDVPIALTLGGEYKYKPALGYSFPQALKSICEGDPRLIVIAIGISVLEELPELTRLTGGRFRPVGVVTDLKILELYYSAADVYLDCFPFGSLTSVLDAARHSLPVQRLYNPHLPIVWNDDVALDAVVAGVSTPEEYVAGLLRWLQWPEEKRAELGGRLRAAILQEHCGASWKTMWLDPALRALSAPCPDPVQSRPEDLEGEHEHYVGLAGLDWGDRPVSMFVAAIIVIMGEVHRRIQFSALLRSIKPWLFDFAHEGMARERSLLFKNLTKGLLPKPFVAAVQKTLRAIRKRL